MSKAPGTASNTQFEDRPLDGARGGLGATGVFLGIAENSGASHEPVPRRPRGGGLNMFGLTENSGFAMNRCPRRPRGGGKGKYSRTTENSGYAMNRCPRQPTGGGEGSDMVSGFL